MKREMAENPVVKVTEIPGPVSCQLMARRERAIPRGVFHSTPIFAAAGHGATVTDVDGNTYLDFAGGIGTLNVGYSHPRVVAAVKAQAERFFHTCFHVMLYEGYVSLAEQLASLVPGDFPKKTLLLNSGAEAVENAVKIARAYTGRPAIIAFTNAFHGRTLMGLALTGKERPYKRGFGPFPPEVYRAPFPYVYRFPGRPTPEECTDWCLEVLEEMFHTHVSPDRVAAVIVEPVQGEGGFIVPPLNFLPRLKAICERHNILFIADEIQTGFGRTGKFLAVEHFGVAPDIVVLGKSLAAGLPLSAVVGRAEIMDAPDVGGLGGTYGGNPLACAAALAVLEVFREERLVERAARIGQLIQRRFEEFYERYPLVGDVRALGAMAAIELVKDRTTKEPAPEETKQVIAACYRRGLILMPAGLYGNVIRVLVPLVATDEQVTRGLDILEEGLRQSGA
ncbi:MAG: 4-aminobutyrate--2-oxoglutarate transaminase [Armatimonadota bacterium]|nr:4-aminobutyrate--2-oxoglutarate transaminase [Armatimonadota bacterium]